MKHLSRPSLISSISLKMCIFHLQCHIPFSLTAFLNQSPTINPVACSSFSVMHGGSDGKILLFFSSILISWVASVFLVFLALTFCHFLSFAILITTGLLPSVSWWACKEYSKNLFVCLTVLFLCITFLHKKKNIDWVTPSTVLMHLHVIVQALTRSVYQEFGQSIATVLSHLLLHFVELIGSFLSIWESELLLYELKSPGIFHVTLICLCE